MSFKIAVLSATLMTGTCLSGAAQARETLNMVCSSPQVICDVIVSEFSRATGIDVAMIRLSTGESYAKLRAEARNPKTDIWFSGSHEAHYQAAAENLTQGYKSPQFDNLIPQVQKMAQETDYIVNAHGIIVLGFAWNEELLRAKNLPEPHSWADLLRPEYRGEIVLSNPNTAGTGYSVLVALVELMGEEEDFSYMKSLNNNVSSYTKSGSAVNNQVARGEATIAVSFVHDANILIKQGFPIKTASPLEGTGYALESLSLIKGARNLKQAKAFVDYILSPQAQSFNAANGWYAYPGLKGRKYQNILQQLRE